MKFQFFTILTEQATRKLKFSWLNNPFQMKQFYYVRPETAFFEMRLTVTT